MRKIIPGLFDDYSYFYEYSGDYFTKEDGYRIHWIFSSEKKKLDFLSREQSLKKAERELVEILPRLNKKGLKTKEEIEEKCSKVLKGRKVERFIYSSTEIVSYNPTNQI